MNDFFLLPISIILYYKSNIQHHYNIIVDNFKKSDGCLQ